MLKLKSRLLILTLFLIIYLSSGFAEQPRVKLDYPAEVSTLSQMFDWIHNNINYTLDNPYHWQSPSTTLNRRAGMCVDIAGLALQWSHDKFGIDGFIILVSLPGNPEGHAFLKFKDLKSWFVEPQTGTIVPTQLEVIDFIITLEDYNDLLQKGESK
jgi:hypothetical protein